MHWVKIGCVSVALVVLVATPSCSGESQTNTATTGGASSGEMGGAGGTGGESMSSSSSGMGGEGGTASTSSSSSGMSSSSSSSSSGGSGFVFIGGGMSTLGVAPAPVNGMQIVSAGFEYTGRSCGGSFCVSGGLVP